VAAIFGRHQFGEAEQEELIERCAEMHGQPQRLIARRLGVSQSTVVRYTALARQRGLVPPAGRKPPEIVDALVAELAVPGWSVAELARKYGYTKAGVYHQAIKHGYYERS
jgi:DNA-binding transcriptional regulator LsrR (DeoR family)